MLDSLGRHLGREATYARAYLRIARRFHGLRRSSRKTVADVFEEQVSQHPDQLALIDGDRRFTYREFDGWANRYARWAREQGVRPGQVVALMMTNRAEFLFAWMGILKAGGAYVPLDPSYPQSRLAFMLGETGAPIALTAQHLEEQLKERALSALRGT